jgi:hypothetical protein
MGSERIVFRVHALQRMFERHISDEEVRRVLDAGETIERYPDDRPYPSRLVAGWIGQRPLHVVVADHAEEHMLIVITVYEPDPVLWAPNFKRRRQ